VRLFVAVWPDASVSTRVASLELEHIRGIRPVASGNLHITLRFLGEVDRGVLPDLATALREAVGGIAGPIRCDVGPATQWFPGVRVLQVPVAGLEEAADAVRKATARVTPEADRDGRFTGHLTLARATAGPSNDTTRGALAGIPFTATFDVDSLDLVVSTLSAGGPRYESLMRAPLQRALRCDPHHHGDDDEADRDGRTAS
jgi:RNA 2',3'-cyclic 3'-phosphodiesterase